MLLSRPNTPENQHKMFNCNLFRVHCIYFLIWSYYIAYLQNSSDIMDKIGVLTAAGGLYLIAFLFYCFTLLFSYFYSGHAFQSKSSLISLVWNGFVSLCKIYELLPAEWSLWAGVHYLHYVGLSLHGDYHQSDLLCWWGFACIVDWERIRRSLGCLIWVKFLLDGCSQADADLDHNLFESIRRRP